MKKIFFLFSIALLVQILSPASLAYSKYFVVNYETPKRISFYDKPDTTEFLVTLSLNDTTSLRIRMQKVVLGNDITLIIRNAEEAIIITELNETKDSLNWRMPVFDSEFRCARSDVSGVLVGYKGVWINHSRSSKNILKVRIIQVPLPPPLPLDWKLHNPPLPKAFSSIRWETTFSPGTNDSTKAIGLFKIDIDGKMTGTFLTETGDYRFLEGCCVKNWKLNNEYNFYFNCFDGSHAFYFGGTMDSLGKVSAADFYSGAHWHETWIAKQNEKFQLRDPEKLTFIKDSSNVNFTFNDLNGNPVSLSDEKFRGKVVIIQIMGSWCPNCMDETEWMSGVYKKYNSQGLEIIALAYERSADTSKANPNIRRVKNHFDADYTFLNTGRTGKDSASASLPFLNGIMSFPTTIYIDRNGKVRMVYTGYNGPATGALFEKDSAEALRLIQQMLAEKKIKN